MSRDAQPVAGPVPAARGGEWTPAARKDAARVAYLASVEAGTPLTGAQLGRQFGCTDRWGRLQIRNFRAELNPNGDGNGSVEGRSVPSSTARNGTVPAARNGAASQPSSADHPAAPSVDRPRRGRPAVSQRNPSIVPAPSAGRNSNGSERAPATEPRPDRVSVPPGTPERPERPATEPDPGSAEDQDRSWVDIANTVVLALVCAAASYGHMYHVALSAGELRWIALAWPITVDGLVIAALRRGPAGRRWLALGIAVSIGSNVLAQFPELAASAGPFVSAWPPIALYGTHRLSHTRRHRPAGSTEAPAD